MFLIRVRKTSDVPAFQGTVAGKACALNDNLCYIKAPLIIAKQFLGELSAKLTEGSVKPYSLLFI